MSRRRRRREPGIIREILGWIFYIIVILVLTYVIITYVGQRTSVSGSSMETTLSDGDQLLVDKLSYRFQDPKRFDIIVFPYQYEENTYYIKRIIGLPGETVQVVDGYVYINGSRLESDIYGNELMDDPMAASHPRFPHDRIFLHFSYTRVTAVLTVIPVIAKYKIFIFSKGNWLRCRHRIVHQFISINV